jgi:hypothetical protein
MKRIFAIALAVATPIAAQESTLPAWVYCYSEPHTREPTRKECRRFIARTNANVAERVKIPGANIGASSVGCAEYCVERYPDLEPRLQPTRDMIREWIRSFQKR